MTSGAGLNESVPVKVVDLVGAGAAPDATRTEFRDVSIDEFDPSVDRPTRKLAVNNRRATAMPPKAHDHLVRERWWATGVPFTVARDRDTPGSPCVALNGSSGSWPGTPTHGSSAAGFGGGGIDCHCSPSKYAYSPISGRTCQPGVSGWVRGSVSSLHCVPSQRRYNEGSLGSSYQPSSRSSTSFPRIENHTESIEEDISSPEPQVSHRNTDLSKVLDRKQGAYRDVHSFE